MLEVLGGFLKLGCSFFGGPVAHLGYFRAEFVDRRRWLDEAAYGRGSPALFAPGSASPCLRRWRSSSSAMARRRGVPGPLFTFCAYLGTVMGPAPHGWQGGLICLLAIYLPSFLLVFGVLPFWSEQRRQAGAQAALRGVNAAVVELLPAALYRPVWTSTIFAAPDVILGIVAFLLLSFWRVPPRLVVILGALGGEAMARLA